MLPLAATCLKAAMTPNWSSIIKGDVSGAPRCRLGDRASYIIYGPLANGATTLMFERADYPDAGRLLAGCTSTRWRSSTPSRPRSGRDGQGDQFSVQAMTFRACGCWDRGRADQPRPGPGTMTR